MESDKILIVEDEKRMAEFLNLELNHEGYDVDICYDGKNGYAPIVGNAKKPSELRNLASVLGDAYKEDKNSSLNSGYPILTWQQ